MAVILIVRVPNRPERPKTISIPRVRRNVCARRSRPASARSSLASRTVDADLQKIGCARSVGHDLADNGRHGIVVDDILDRGAPVASWVGRVDPNGALSIRDETLRGLGRIM